MIDGSVNLISQALLYGGIGALILRWHEAIEAELEPANEPAADDLAEARAKIEPPWEEFPTHVGRDILTNYVSTGFQPTRDRRLRAEVCGVLLEVEVPKSEPLTPCAKGATKWGTARR